MIWKNKDKKKDAKKELDKEIQEIIDMGDDEFFLSEEIDGYASCAGLNAQRCSTECFRQVMMPTVTVLS